MNPVAVVVVSSVEESEGQAAESLVKALAAIGRQKTAPAEVVVVAAGKDPGVAEDAMAGIAADSLFLEVPGAGLGEALALGVSKTTAPLLAFSDGSSVWNEKKLSAQASAFVRPGVDLCGHREEFERDGRRTVVAEHTEEAPFSPLLRALRRPAFPLSSAMMRRAAWQRLQGLREGPDAWQDFLVRAVLGRVPHVLLEMPLGEVSAERPDWPEPPPGLSADAPRFENIREQLDGLPPDRLFDTPPASPRDAAAVKAGLYWLYDDLDACHRIAQSAEGHANSDFWHALMHRREGDFGNSGYWFARVGQHPIFPDLLREAQAILDSAVGKAAAELRTKLERAGEWDPRAFVEFCRLCVEGNAGRAAADVARRIQMAEFRLLLLHCHRSATGVQS